MQKELQLLEKKHCIDWQEYEIGELFDIQNTLSFNKDKLTVGNEYDYITRTSQNQGILQETGFVNQENINDAGTWSLGLLQMDFFYRQKPWYAGQFIRKIIPKIKLSKSAVLYFTVLLNKQKNILLQGLVRDVDNAFLTSKITLPTFNNKIAFAYIEEFLATLDAERLATLDAYLTTTNLKDYTLTKEEKEALEKIESVKWGEFRIGELFEKIKVNSLKYKTSNLPSEAKGEFILPALTAGIQNQGLNNFVPKENATILKNVISISANGANTGATFYQSKEFTVLQDAYAIKWIYTKDKLTDNHYLFLTGSISKTIYGNYEWTNKAGWERIKTDKIFIPVQPDNTPDFAFMTTYIRAVQKIVIKNVVEWADKRIAKTKEVVEC